MAPFFRFFNFIECSIIVEIILYMGSFIVMVYLQTIVSKGTKFAATENQNKT
jgi:hypothetical protein